MIDAPAKFKVASFDGLGDAFTRKYVIRPLTLTLVWSRSHETLPSSLYVIWHMQRLKLLRPTVKEEIDLQENTLFDI